jgi:hypothetical protein
MTVKLVGSTSGSVSLQAPASTTGGAHRVLTLPDVNGTIATTTTAGKILQVVQTTKTNTQSIQSQSFTDVTGLSATITPSSTSSKILVTFNISIGCNNYGMINLLRGSTDIFKGGTDGSRISCTIAVATLAAYECKSYGTSYLDSPNTTSATTYKIQAATPYDPGYYIKVNMAHTDTNANYLPRPTSQITLLEVA